MKNAAMIPLLASIMGACTSESPVSPETEQIVAEAADRFYKKSKLYEAIRKRNREYEACIEDTKYDPQKRCAYLLNQKNDKDQMDELKSAQEDMERMAEIALRSDSKSDQYECIEIYWYSYSHAVSGELSVERNTTLWDSDGQNPLRFSIKSYLGDELKWTKIDLADERWTRREPGCQ